MLHYCIVLVTGFGFDLDLNLFPGEPQGILNVNIEKYSNLVTTPMSAPTDVKP